MRSALLVHLAIVLVLAPAPARAQTPEAPRWPVQLTYTRGAAASDCADERGLRKAVIDELGADPFQPTAPLQLTVHVDRRAGELVAEMEERNEVGRLIWRSNDIKTRGSCKLLISTLGLDIVIHLQATPTPPACPVCPAPPSPAELPPVAPAPPVSPTPSPALPKAEPPATVIEPQKPASRPRWLLGAGALVGMGVPVSAVAGFSLFGGPRWEHFSVAVEARVVLPVAGGDQGARIKTLFAGGVVVPCGHLSALFGCGLLQLGTVNLSGPDAPLHYEHPFSASAGFRAGAEQQLGARLMLRERVDLLGTMVHPRYQLASLLVWDVPGIIGVVGLDLALRF